MGIPGGPVTSVAVSYGSSYGSMIFVTHSLFVSAIESEASPERDVLRARSVMRRAAPVVIEAASRTLDGLLMTS